MHSEKSTFATADSGLVLDAPRLIQLLKVSILVVGMALSISVFNGGLFNASVLLAALSLLIAAHRFANSGHVKRAATLMLVTLTVCVCLFMFISDGIRDEAVSAFPGILIFASMFGTRRLFIGLLLLICIALVSVVCANLWGWHVNTVAPLNWGTLINVLAILLGTSFFVWLLANDLKNALMRLEVENRRLQDSKDRIEILAHHDSLTNLPNRVLARDRLEQVMAAARRSGTSAAVCYLDLDNFKTINDSLGHNAGDALLCEVAQRLVACVREGDTVSRQGGDEFLIVLGGLQDEEAASAAAMKIIEQLNLPLQIDGHDISATASLGIAMFPKDGADADTLLKNSDLAMYRAKDCGRNTYQFFNAEMNSSVVEHLHLATGIRTALANNDFRLHYQPQFDLKSGRVVGAEALLRWQHAKLGYMSPDKFIPVAERSGQINALGTWVLNEACRQAKLWSAEGLGSLVVAVNVSPVQFRRDDIEHEVSNALTMHGLAPSSIELELTESLLVANAGQVTGVLKRLGKIGVQFSIDDFGTGYSNLGYLKRFDVDRLKIDQSFIRQMTRNPHDDGIVRAIIEIAHCLDMEVVAEGVEDLATLKRLQDLGCDFGQGYFWSPALAPGEFSKFVLSHKTA